MDNNQIIARAGDITRAGKKYFHRAATIFVILEVYSNNFGRGLVSNAISSLLLAFITAMEVYFYYNAYVDGAPSMSNILGIFKNNARVTKMLAIVLLRFIINFLFGFAEAVTGYTIILILVSVAISLAEEFVSFLLNFVWYLYVANPDLPTDYYFKGSIKYISSFLGEYIVYMIRVNIVRVAALIVATLLLGPFWGSLICVPLMAKPAVSMAGFAYEHIPTEWKIGTVRM